MKTFFLTLLSVLVFNIAGAYTIKYHNKDSKKHVMEVKANGSTTKIEFNSSTSGSTSVQTSASEIEIKTECGWVKVKNGAQITIEKGCIKIN
jgi:predicted glutamine amidotransferase